MSLFSSLRRRVWSVVEAFGIISLWESFEKKSEKDVVPQELTKASDSYEPTIEEDLLDGYGHYDEELDEEDDDEDDW